MISVIATLTVKEGKEEEFESIMKELADTVRAKEDGCQLYVLNKSKKSGAYVMIERYTDKDAVTAHMGSEYFKAASMKMMGCIEGPPQIEQLEEVY